MSPDLISFSTDDADNNVTLLISSIIFLTSAKVPIYIGYMDYEKKIGGFHSAFEPTVDVDKDIAYIKSILSQYKGKYPEKGIKNE